jgi:ATP-binding cassette subfamily C protein CydC
MFPNVRRVLATGQSRHLRTVIVGSLGLGILAGAASAGLLALAGWFIAMSALAGAGLASGFSFFYPSAGVQALAFGRTALRYLERLFGHSGTQRIDAGLREAVFAAAVGPSVPGAHSGPADPERTRIERTGRLLHAIESDAEVVEIALLRVLAPVVTYVGVLIGGCLLIGVTVSPVAAVIIACGGSVVGVVVVLPGWASSLRPGRVLAEGESRARQELVDALDGLDELASFGAEALAFDRIEQAFAVVERSQQRLRLIEVATRAVAVGVVGATVLLVAAFTSGSVGTHRIAVASAAAVTLAALGILQLSDPLAGAAREMARTKSVWARLAEILPKPGRQTGALRPSHRPSGSVAVQHLSVDRGRGPILQDLSFTALPGQTVLLTGPSGAGKTTVILALAGQLAVDLGAGGEAGLAGKVVSLPQHPYAFRGTVADNLRIADPAAGEEAMQEALVLVGLSDALGTAPLREVIGEGGRPLSGGQLRRLAIAQVLLAKPDVLLADEATEGLDADAARDLLLTLRLSDPLMTMVLALHEQQYDQLSWTPDTVVNLHTDRRSAQASPL